MKLVSMISAFVLVIGMLLIGVFAVERVQVDMGGSITFNADDVYARVTGSVANAQVAPAGLDVTYSAYETKGNPTAWESLDLEFDSYATPIVISITVENLSTERSLTVNLTDALTSSVPNLGKALQRDNGAYTSGSNITLDPKDNGTSTTTFTITLSVTDKNQSLTNAQFDYDLNLYDENYKFPEVYDYFTFSDNGDGTVRLTDFNESLAGGKTDIVIPATVSQNADGQWIDGDDYTVVGIADGYRDPFFPSNTSGCFAKNTTITSVVLPDTLKSIGEAAFYGCTNLASITFPSSLTSIGEGAFSQCNGLTSIDLNNCTNLTSIRKYAFYRCRGLTGELNLGECTSLKSIGDFAFEFCNGLKSITLPSSLTSIGLEAFNGCSGFTSINLSECASLTNIKDSAFSDCSSLTSITLPSSLIRIASTTFNGCSGLESITVEKDNPVFHSEGNCLIETESKTLVLGCKNSSIPSYITSIGDYAFYRCTGLTSITLPEGLTSIESNAFSHCYGLKSITLPEGLTSIGGNAFKSCDGLTGELNLGECTSLTSIDYGAFWDCEGLKSITLPESLTSIESYAFYGCSALESVVFPEGSTGWYVTQDETATSGEAVDVTNSRTNARNLTGKYFTHYWKRG